MFVSGAWCVDVIADRGARHNDPDAVSETRPRPVSTGDHCHARLARSHVRRAHPHSNDACQGRPADEGDCTPPLSVWKIIAVTSCSQVRRCLSNNNSVQSTRFFSLHTRHLEQSPLLTHMLPSDEP